MGFDIQGTRLVLLAGRQGVDFTRTVTLGRQWLGVDAPDLDALIREMHVDLDADQRQAISVGLPYADGLLRALGARTVESLDASAYEGASIVHDLNEELPRALAGRFTLVIDCGTLEHVFNFPVAIRNCMRLLQVGGHLLLATPTNNFMGHGFYQFSPELFYRVLSPENGFRVQKMYVSELRRSASWYELTDPASLRGRVELVNALPAYLLICATRVSDTIPLMKVPQQSDYAQGAWQQSAHSANGAVARGRLAAFARNVAPDWLKDLRAGLRASRFQFRAAYFKRVDDRSREALKRD